MRIEQAFCPTQNVRILGPTDFLAPKRGILHLVPTTVVAELVTIEFVNSDYQARSFMYGS